MAFDIADHEEQSTLPKAKTPLEVFRSWTKHPTIGKLRLPGKVLPLLPEPQRAEFTAKNGKPDILFQVTIIKLKKGGSCTLRCSKMDVDEELEVPLLKTIAGWGQGEWATIRLINNKVISADRASLKRALTELGYLP